MTDEKNKKLVEDTKEMSPAEAELLEVQFERDLANAKEERTRAQLVLTEHEVLLVEFEKLQPLIEGYMDNITPENVKKIEAEYYYEKDDNYWTLIAQVQRIEWLQKFFFNKDKAIKGMTDTVIAKRETIASLTEKISLMDGDSDE